MNDFESENLYVVNFLNRQYLYRSIRLISIKLFEENIIQLEVWANVQRDGRPAEYRWRPLFNAAKFG